MNKNLIIGLIVFLGLFLVVIIWGGILINKYKMTTPIDTGMQKRERAPDISQEKGSAPSLRPVPDYPKSAPKKVEEPVEEIEIIPPGQNPEVLIN